MEKDVRSVPLYMERNSLRCVLERASRSGYVAAGTAVADELMDDVDVKESHTSSSADPAVESPAKVASTPAPVENVVEHQRVVFPVARTGSPDLRNERSALSTAVSIRTDRSKEGGGVSANQEEGVGGGYRNGDTKDPPWSSPTF